jgi:ribosomal protein S18 acetylase RimI-like enzyme
MPEPATDERAIHATSSTKRGTVIRPTYPGDTRAILALASRTGIFKPHEVTALEEVLSDYHAAHAKLDNRAITYEEHGEILGFAYYAPAENADRTWYLHWIGVTRQTQARGIGTELLLYIEDDIRSRRGRLLLVQTSSLPYYDLARKFYEKHEYERSAEIKDFYSDGDSMVIYAKRLA